MLDAAPALVVLLLAGCGSQADQSESGARQGWVVDVESSRLGFEGVQTGNKFAGEFEKFDAAIVFDPEDIGNARIKVEVDTGSAKTGDRQRDGALGGADWFAVKTFPKATFVSNDVELTGDGAYAANGTLTIRNVARDLRLPFTLAIEGDRATAEGEVTLTRTDFGVGQGEFATAQWAGLDVKVFFNIEATR